MLTTAVCAGFGFAKLYWPRRRCQNGKGLFSPWTPVPLTLLCRLLWPGCLPLLHSSKVGVEYEVSNGGVIVNLGERRATAKTEMDCDASPIMSFQVVELHKPFLAVSRLVEAGHKVLFNKVDPTHFHRPARKWG